MVSTSITMTAGVVVWAVALSSGAYGQLVPIYDCDEQYQGPAMTSQEGNGYHRRVYQPMSVVEAEPYTVRHITIIFNAGTATQNYSIALLTGREATLEFLFGDYDDGNDVFVEDTSLPRPAPIAVTFGPENLTNASEDPQFIRQFDIDIAVPAPAGKKLHIGLIGFFDWLPNNEVITIKESALHAGENPLPLESAWWVKPDDPGQPHGRALNPPSHPTGNLAMRVDVEMCPACPAVSTWGIIVMTLLMLTAGTLVHRHRAVAA